MGITLLKETNTFFVYVTVFIDKPPGAAIYTMHSTYNKIFFIILISN